jgi:hypothetical protein
MLSSKLLLNKKLNVVIFSSSHNGHYSQNVYPAWHVGNEHNCVRGDAWFESLSIPNQVGIRGYECLLHIMQCCFIFPKIRLVGFEG